MRKPGANKRDQREIRRMALEGHSVENISRITGVKMKNVENFLPTQDEVNRMSAPTVQGGPAKPTLRPLGTPAEVKAGGGGAEKGAPPVNLTDADKGIEVAETSD